MKLGIGHQPMNRQHSKLFGFYWLLFFTVFHRRRRCLFIGHSNFTDIWLIHWWLRSGRSCGEAVERQCSARPSAKDCQKHGRTIIVVNNVVVGACYYCLFIIIIIAIAMDVNGRLLFDLLCVQQQAICDHHNWAPTVVGQHSRSTTNNNNN